MKNTKVTIIGYGTMGAAIGRAILSQDKSIQISIVKRGSDFKDLPGADFIVLAVKPKDIRELALEIKDTLDQKSIIVSILAGTTIKTLSTLLHSKRVVRTMPNLGLSIGAGIAVWKMNEQFTSKEQSAVRNFLNLICENIEVKDEAMIDAATAISGSGPAYFFLLADGMLKAAKKLKLPEDTSRKLVTKTFLAAALLAENADYQELIGRIASKGGTTEAALNVFQKEKFSSIIEHAVKAANKKAKEISKKK